ncbi:GNAT family N-acetyltransferase [Cellulomonas soli]
MSGSTSVRRAAERQRYELVDEGAGPAGGVDPAIIGFAEYRDVGADPVRRVFFHTVVDPAFEGRGLAGRLVAAALDDTVAAGHRIVPVCTYLAAYVRRHQTWDASLEAVQPGDLAALPAQ